MKQKNVDQALRYLASIPLPRVQDNLAASVLREVRLRQMRAGAHWAELLAGWLWQRQIALASMIAAVVAGLSVAILSPLQPSRSTVSQHLFLDVFSQSSRTLPSTYIALDR
ncbi:MAG TPA: hypothetical protein VFA51_12745 [Candidatus Udaeobacter sp.]|nr:hypothetical protein [Candidatus Udaeobacter sp.]